MKNFILILFCLYLIPVSNTYSQPQPECPLPPLNIEDFLPKDLRIMWDNERILSQGVKLHWAMCGNRGLVLKTTNGGVNWCCWSIATYKNLNSIFFSNPDTGWVVGDSGIVYKCNNGINWLTQISGIFSNLRSVYFIQKDSGWIAGDSGKVLRTSNGGTNWAIYTVGSTSINYRSIMFRNQQGWVVGTSGKIYHTTNGGSTWLLQLSGDTTTTLNKVYFIDYYTGYAAGNGGKVVKTTNGGVLWFMLPNYSTNNLNSIFFINGLTGWAVGDAGKIIKTTNGGFLWITQIPPTVKNLTSVCFSSADTGLAVGYDSCLIIKTVSTGNSWFKQFPSNCIVKVEGNSNTIPNQFSLYQNYPNPFNPTTKIRFDIPTPPQPSPKGSGSSSVNLIIYDILGREVATLVNEQLNPGNYEVEWDGTNYPSGVYYYKLSINPSDGAERSNGFSETKKMVLIK